MFDSQCATKAESDLQVLHQELPDRQRVFPAPVPPAYPRPALPRRVSPNQVPTRVVELLQPLDEKLHIVTELYENKTRKVCDNSCPRFSTNVTFLLCVLAGPLIALCQPAAVAV